MKASKLARILLSAGFVWLAVGPLTLGCGGTEEVASTSWNAAHEEAALPDEVVARLTSCAKQAAAALKPNGNAIVFNVKVTPRGRVSFVGVRDSMIRDRTLIACMTHALEDMSLSPSDLAMRSSPPESGGLVAPRSRELMGNPAILGGAFVAIGPIVLVAAGVTILVAVFVYGVARISDECRKAKQDCIEKCTDTKLPTGTYDGMPYHECMRICMDAAGCF